MASNVVHFVVQVLDWCTKVGGLCDVRMSQRQQGVISQRGLRKRMMWRSGLWMA